MSNSKLCVVQNTHKNIRKICCKICPKNVSHQNLMICPGKDQNSDSDDFEKDRYAKECNPEPSVRFDFKSCRN